MHGQTPRLYYGWIVVAIGFFTMMLVMGTFFSSGVLFAAIIAEYGWSRAVTALPFSVALICYAFTAWLAGRLFDRYGPQLLFPLGVVCLGVGILLSTWASTTWHWCLSWGVLVAQGFNLAGIAPHLALAALWFNRQRGVASGLMLSGASMGALVVVPGVQYLVEQYGWRFAYTVLGVVVMGCLLPLNALWQRHHPAVLGLYPDGATTPPPLYSTPSAHNTMPPPWTLWRAMQTGRFWWLFLMVICIGWQGNITSVHQIAHMTGNGFSGLLAASIVGLMGLPRAVSSPICGSLSDRLGREVVCILGTVFSIVGLSCLVLLQPSAPVWLLYGYALAYGVGYGAYGATEAAATADLFYGPYLGTILGALELGWGIGGFGGSWVGGYWYDRWGTYQGAFVLTMGMSCLGCLALWCAAPRHARQATPHLVPVPRRPEEQT
jgi:MFS family permease